MKEIWPRLSTRKTWREAQKNPAEQWVTCPPYRVAIIPPNRGLRSLRRTKHRSTPTNVQLGRFTPIGKHTCDCLSQPKEGPAIADNIDTRKQQNKTRKENSYPRNPDPCPNPKPDQVPLPKSVEDSHERKRILVFSFNRGERGLGKFKKFSKNGK